MSVCVCVHVYVCMYVCMYKSHDHVMALSRTCYNYTHTHTQPIMLYKRKWLVSNGEWVPT